ncbi:dicarboxylate/amino acid:cation symporter [Actinokineospora sp. G85]|uniref:dicarboxylate/amino acid:cation symporter n=1 Tax=Actinokineospora sp. G85 TaxID=3406626 RepID=UPI003C72F9DC
MSKKFGLAVLAGLVLGAVLGYLAQATDASWLTTTLTTVGKVFTSLLQFTVIPLVFTAIVIGLVSLRSLGGGRTAARLGGRTLLWFAVTSLIAVGLGLAIGTVSGAGSGIVVEPSAATVERLAERAQGDWLTLLDGLVPSNLFAAFAEGEILQVVFVAALVGAAAYALGAKAEPFVALTRSLFDIVQKVVGWIIWLAPIGVAGLIGTAVATYGNQFVAPLLSLIAAVYVGCLVILAVVYPVLLKVVGGVSPLRFYRTSWNALQFAFVSRSSSATLPLSRQAAVDLGVDPGYAGFAVPLGTTTKMDGCAALYPAIATLFIANLFGISLSPWQYVGIAAVAVFGAFATAGTTGWFTMLTLTLSTIGLPPEVIATGVAIVYGIDPILDMARTATNVAGQITVPVLVARGEGLLRDGEQAPAEEREPVNAA